MIIFNYQLSIVNLEKCSEDFHIPTFRPFYGDYGVIHTLLSL